MQHQSLLSQIQKKINLDEASFDLIRENFELKEIKKKEYILKEGSTCNFIAFVLNGCFKTYITQENGKECILYFAIEDWWLSDIDSFNNSTVSTLSVQALEDSAILMINQSRFEYLTKNIPPFEKLFRVMTQSSLVSTQRRLLSTLSDTAEERYIKFIKTYPNIRQKVNNKQIASYLGITSEMVSIIRNRIAKKQVNR